MTSRRIDHAFDRLTDARAETIAHGHDATTTPVEKGSFYVQPPAVDALARFDEGIPVALRRHLASQHLTSLSSVVDDLEAIAQRLRRRDKSDHDVSAVVYQMH